MALVLDEDLDNVIEDGKLKEDSTGMDIIVAAFLTNGKKNDGTGGYWIDMPSSSLWKFKQSRSPSQSELDAMIDEVIKKLDATGVFDYVSATATAEGSSVKVDVSFSKEGKEQNGTIEV